MKKFSKILSVALLVALVLSLGATNAFAEDPTFSITINNKVSGFTYYAYQIFTGDLDNGVLSNVEWGNGITTTGQDALYSRYHLTGDNQTARKVAEAIAAVGTTEAQKQAEADAIATLLDGTSGALGTGTKLNYDDSTEGSECYKATGLASGYYMVVNTAVPDGIEITFSDYIVNLVGNVEVNPKSGTPESEKKVEDINDSTGEQSKDPKTNSVLIDSADYDIGDVIPYTLTAKLPSDYANYSSYNLVFVDDMSPGLTLNADSVKIYYGASDTTGTSITFAEAGTTSYPTTSYDSIEKNGTTYTGHVYSYAINDLKTDNATKNLGAGDVITITYTATLNEAAVIGSAGNPNVYRIEFSNNPNGEGEGHTPWDKNIVFTYKTVFNKVDGEEKPLDGANFELFKFVKGAKNDKGEFETYKNVEGAWVNVTELHSGTGAKNPTKTVTGTAAREAVGTPGEDGYKPAAAATTQSVFAFAGLDDGYYKLVETETPATYNSIDDIYFEITADHTLVADNPTLNDLDGTDGHEFTMSKNVPAGELSKDIQNNKGAVLPSTGGIGTTIFYAVGGILVLAAIVLLITKKRMSD